MNIGYHYTTLENWNKIKVEGLKPYTVTEDNLKSSDLLLKSSDLDKILIDTQHLKEVFKGTVPECIWIWKYQLTQPTHLGTLLFQLITKVSFEICVIAVEYSDRAILKPAILKPFQNYNYNHNGNIGAWQYHKDVPFELLKKTILPKNLKLIECFDFIALTKFKAQ